MSLPARQHRILKEIERDLTETDPRLARALAAGKLPALPWPRLVTANRGFLSRWLWSAVILAPLLSGVTLLSLGCAFRAPALMYTGVPLAQFGPLLARCWRHRVNNRLPGGGSPK